MTAKEKRKLEESLILDILSEGFSLVCVENGAKIDYGSFEGNYDVKRWNQIDGKPYQTIRGAMRAAKKL